MLQSFTVEPSERRPERQTVCIFTPMLSHMKQTTRNILARINSVRKLVGGRINTDTNRPDKLKSQSC